MVPCLSYPPPGAALSASTHKQECPAGCIHFVADVCSAFSGDSCARPINRHAEKFFQRQIPESFVTLITRIHVALRVVEDFLNTLVPRFLLRIILLAIDQPC